MESEPGFAVSDLPMPPEAPREADSRAMTGVLRWLEDAWRNGEIIVDSDELETHLPATQPNRFAVAHDDAGTPPSDVM